MLILGAAVPIFILRRTALFMFILLSIPVTTFPILISRFLPVTPIFVLVPFFILRAAGLVFPIFVAGALMLLVLGRFLLVPVFVFVAMPIGVLFVVTAVLVLVG